MRSVIADIAASVFLISAALAALWGGVYLWLAQSGAPAASAGESLLIESAMFAAMGVGAKVFSLFWKN